MLTGEGLAIVAEEEALLERVRTRLLAEPSRRITDDRAGHRDHLQHLRDEANTASASDLPHLFQQMTAARAMAVREKVTALPDAGTPYFAHLQLESDLGVRDFLLGRATFIDTAADVRIVDWRFAPVAQIFYRYQAGDDYEEQLPSGTSEGIVRARRVVVIEQGRLTRIIDGTRLFVRDANGEWQEGGAGAVLSGGSGTAARPGVLGVGRDATRRAGKADISALLDAEQFEALSADANTPLLVLGSAGSGKTTVALHRLAKLSFDDAARFPPQKLRVVVPEEGLARLSKRLLEPLGLGRVRVDTLDATLYELACQVFGARTIKLSDETPGLVAQLKRHPALRDALVQRMGRTAEATLPRLRLKLLDLLGDPAFVQGVVDAANGSLPQTTVNETVRYTRQLLASSVEKELRGVDAERRQAIDGASITEGTPEALAGAIDPEDLPLLLYFRAKEGGLPIDKLAHLVLDEAEDFSLFELDVFGRLLSKPRSATLAGDEMQQTHSSFAGWTPALEAMGVANASTVRLHTSYRCPAPITELAQKVLGKELEARPARPGAPVGFHDFPDEAQAQLFLASALRDLTDREPEASVGVIASTSAAARSVFQALESIPSTRLVLDGRFTFEPGIDVTDVDSIKGLEFDYVILPDVTARAYPIDDDARRRLHVAVTRASHQLWIVSPGRRTTLVGP